MTSNLVRLQASGAKRPFKAFAPDAENGIRLDKQQPFIKSISTSSQAEESIKHPFATHDLHHDLCPS